MLVLHALSLSVKFVPHELTNPSAVFDKEFSFGDHVQSFGILTNGSPNYKDFRLNSESIWKDAVEYSSINITMEQCFFQNEECFSAENSQLPTGSVCLDMNTDSHTLSNNRKSSSAGFPLSTPQKECMIKNFEETTSQSCGMPSDPGQQKPNLNEKRVRNNKACKKFREARKNRHEQLYVMEEKMLKENYFLKHRINALENEIKKWKEFFGNLK